MTRAENKASRLLEIEALLLAHPEGLNQAEIARRLGVNRSTILRNLADVPNISQEDDGRMRIDRAAYLLNVRQNLDEALALHLATRLLATRLDRQNPHAAAALRKLGISMEKLAPRISAHMLQSADVMDDPDFQRQDPVLPGGFGTPDPGLGGAAQGARVAPPRGRPRLRLHFRTLFH